MCRAKAGDCDVAETCDGVSGACPPDGYLSYGTLCNASSGACTQSAVCSGYNAKCPDAAQKAVGAACDDGNPCTSPDTCDALGQCLGRALAVRASVKSIVIVPTVRRRAVCRRASTTSASTRPVRPGLCVVRP